MTIHPGLPRKLHFTCCPILIFNSNPCISQSSPEKQNQQNVEREREINDIDIERDLL